MRRPDKAGGKASRARRPKGSRSHTAPKVTHPQVKQARNALLRRERDEALEQQAATAEILSVISNSPTDTQPVFDAIVQSGLKLFPHALISIALRDGGMFKIAAIAELMADKGYQSSTHVASLSHSSQ